MERKFRFQITVQRPRAILVLVLYLQLIHDASARTDSKLAPIGLVHVLRLSGGSSDEEVRPFETIETDIIIEARSTNHIPPPPVEDNVVVTPKKSPVFLSDRTRLLGRRRVASSLKQHIAELQNRSSACVDTIYKSLVERNNNASHFFAILASQAGSSSHKGLALWKLYLLALLGSSVGFSMFLYFISVGYALGISLPLTVSLVHYNRLQNRNNHFELSVGTIFHTFITILWGIRSTVFFLWREYVSWPALHARMVQVNDEQKPSILIQIICWLVYSAAYVAMQSPCTIRLDTCYSLTSAAHGSFSQWALQLSPLLQVTGLLLESLADYQKCQFKSRSAWWCHEGLWKYSTHPNYAGEWIFWLGTVLGGLPFSRSVYQTVLILAGFLFISTVLHGATKSLDSRHFEKYASLPEYNDFKSEFGVFGPKLHLWLQRAWLERREKRKFDGASDIDMDVEQVADEGREENAAES